MGERSRGSQIKVKRIQILEKSFPSKSETEMGPFGACLLPIMQEGRSFLTREGWVSISSETSL